MKLTTLTARAFKGLTFTLDLKTLNFLVGSNFAGKTARTDAIRFLLLGYLPELGKTNAATFGLASGKEMVVEGTFDNGMTIKRRRYLQGDSVKTDDTVPKELEDAGQLAVMLNAETYFALSDRERVNYVFANCPMPPGWSIADIIEKVDAALPAETTPTTTELASKLLDLASVDTTPQAFVEAALSMLTADAKTTKAYAERMDKGTQMVATLKAQEASNPIRSIHELDADRAIITKDIETLQADKAQHQEAYNAMVRARGRRQQIVHETRNLESYRNKLTALQQRIEVKKVELNAAPSADQASIETVLALELDETKAHSELVHQQRTGRTALERLKAEFLEIELKTQCPYCGAKGDAWKTIRRTDINGASTGLEARDKQLVDEIQTAATKIEDARASRSTLQRNQQAYDRLERELTTLTNDATLTARDIATLERMLDELGHLPAEDAGIMAAVETAQSALNVANGQLHAIDELRKQSMAREQDKKRIAMAATERDKAKADLEIYVTAGKRLREIQGQMVQVAFDPMLTHANSFFATILKTPIAYNTGEIGTWRDGVWVGHRTFSGTEKAMTYAAIQAALTVNSPIRIMMVDELGRLDRRNAQKLQNTIEKSLEAGTIDQFIGIDATDRYHEDFTNVACQILTIA